MLDNLRAWLNGTREYNLGVSLYNKMGDNNELKKLFKKGKTDYCHKRLQGELMQICIELKSKLYENTQSLKKQERPENSHNQKQADQAKANSTPAVENANPDLYAACKLAADKIYKEAMNSRAVLFSMVPSELFEDPNRPDLVEARSNLSLKVVQLYNEASSLYDRADYVRIHGKFPNELNVLPDYLDTISDHLVKSKLDNLRKNLNKIKSREQTPDRVALLQKHQDDIIKLEERWLSLKQKK